MGRGGLVDVKLGGVWKPPCGLHLALQFDDALFDQAELPAQRVRARPAAGS